MVLKRHFIERDDDGYEVPGRESRRRLMSATVVRDVMNGLSLHEFVSTLEPFIQRVVREEVERALQSFRHSSPRSSLNQIESSGARPWQLHFSNKLPSTLFTCSTIESVDSKQVKVVIIDANSKKIVTSGPLSSVKLEIVVLDGEFSADEQDDWTEKDFNASVVRERVGKRPLVAGELIMTLRDGVGYIGDISFTDNSSWIRSRKFRLGVRVQRTSTELRVREAISEPFIVKDHRGESYKKHHPPSLGDEIWRLERIAKDGAFHKRLAFTGISTVKDLLQLYVTDPQSLRDILGAISNKTWETIVEHAATCVLDDNLYMFYKAADSFGLVFNSIFKVVGATFDGQNYHCLDKLNGFQMRLVEDLKRQAYKNLNDLEPINYPSVVGPPMLLSSLQDDPFNSPSLGLQNVNIPVTQQDQLQMQLGSNHMSSSPPYTYEVEDKSQLEVSGPRNSHSMKVFSPTLRNSFVMTDCCYGPYGGGYSLAPSGSLGSDVLIGNLAAEENTQVETSIWQGNELYIAPCSSNFCTHFSSNGKPKARWCKIRAAIKWVSVRRNVAAKKRAMLLPYIDF